MGKVTFYGNTNIGRIHLENTSFNEDYFSRIDSLGLEDDVWNNNSVVLANLNGNFSGNGADYQWDNIIKFKVYKTVGAGNDKLYKVYETSSIGEKIVEDFVIGDNCEYKYYVYPVCESTKDGILIETLGSVVESNTIKFNENTLSVYELIQDKDDESIYRVNKDNIWLFHCNLDDPGFTINTNKSFKNTGSQYQQEIASYRKHRTKSVSALVGDISCATHDYTETYEMLTAWNKFCSSPSLKLLTDTHGQVLIGDIDNNSQLKYDTSFSTVSFSFIELSDVDNIAICGRIVNPQELDGVSLIDYSIDENDLKLIGFSYSIDVFGDLTFKIET